MKMETVLDLQHTYTDTKANRNTDSLSLSLSLSLARACTHKTTIVFWTSEKHRLHTHTHTHGGGEVRVWKHMHKESFRSIISATSQKAQAMAKRRIKSTLALITTHILPPSLSLSRIHSQTERQRHRHRQRTGQDIFRNATAEEILATEYRSSKYMCLVKRDRERDREGTGVSVCVHVCKCV